jgi:hypothetical protein
MVLSAEPGLKRLGFELNGGRSRPAPSTSPHGLGVHDVPPTRRQLRQGDDPFAFPSSLQFEFYAQWTGPGPFVPRWRRSSASASRRPCGLATPSEP